MDGEKWGGERGSDVAVLTPINGYPTSFLSLLNQFFQVFPNA